MRFAEVVDLSGAVASTSSRTAKRDQIAALLGRLDPSEVEPVVGFLTGQPRQGRIGVGYRTMAGARSTPAASPSLTVADVDGVLGRLDSLHGDGSAADRLSMLSWLFSRATREEIDFLVRMIGGELRQGASAGVVSDAVAVASSTSAAAVRRAVMLGGGLGTVARVALDGGPDALDGVGLELGRPLQPMLASTASTVTEAVEAMGMSLVEWKLDGIRIQVHRHGDDVRIWTRNLNDITDRLPAVVAAVAGLDAEALVLDGEALVLDEAGRPELFQDTVSWRARNASDADSSVPVPGPRPFFFDLVHLDGTDLIDEPLGRRIAALRQVAAAWCMPGIVTDDPAAAELVLAESVAAGHEGVVAKSIDSPYAAGRRGTAWRKVKPVYSLDLVVLAAEWGHGRRTGWLSNLHLGAVEDVGSGFVMVGKTFKGMTDQLLAWQTARFLELAGLDAPDPAARRGTVSIPPVQVVEVAVDGVQRSTRYPGGVALRFARVLRYRDDKEPADADRIASLVAML